MCLLWWGISPRHPGMACRRWRGSCYGVLADGADGDEAFVTEIANFVEDYDAYGYR